MDSPAPRTHKQVIVLRKDLGMNKGKVGAQAGHAVLRAFTEAPDVRIETTEAGRVLCIPLDEDAVHWLQHDYTKVCLAAKDEVHLLDLHAQALAAGLRCALILDNGWTAFQGVKTYTALAIGPHANARIDALTANLPLF